MPRILSRQRLVATKDDSHHIYCLEVVTEVAGHFIQIETTHFLSATDRREEANKFWDPDLRQPIEGVLSIRVWDSHYCGSSSRVVPVDPSDFFSGVRHGSF